MIPLAGMDEALEQVGVQAIEIKEPKVKIPWEKIDEWISSVDLSGVKPDENKVVDAGDRRN